MRGILHFCISLYFKTLGMNKILSIGVFVFSFLALHSQSTVYFDYVERYKELAIQEMERSGVPASIKLGQGILESAGGTSTLALRANNHFGIKCGSSWKGKTFFRVDDDRNDKGELIKSCFRKYKSTEACYVAHSEFLRNNKRYDFLFFLNPRDYKSWAHGLKKAGYATSATYAEKLIGVIESYELYKLDNVTSSDILAGNTSSPSLTGVLLTNDVKMLLAKGGQTPAEIAHLTNTKVQCVLKYNERLSDANQSLADDERVYIQKKRRSFREKKKYHYVKGEDNMYQISQLYGVRLKRLYKRNRMPENSQPAVDERIKLSGLKVRNAPKLRNLLTPQSGKKIILPDDNNDNQLDLQDEDGNLITLPKNETTDSGEKKRWWQIKNSSSKKKKNYHTVQDGDNMLKIAQAYNVSLKDLYERNRMPANTQPKVGQQIKVKGRKIRQKDIPEVKPETSAWSNEGKDQPNNPTGDRQVPGNGSSDVVTFPQPDQIVPPVTRPDTDTPSGTGVIPPVSRPTDTNSTLPDEVNAQYYTVAKGDTLYSISKKFGTDIPTIRKLNGLNSNLIRPGQQLRVK